MLNTGQTPARPQDGLVGGPSAPVHAHALLGVPFDSDPAPSTESVASSLLRSLEPAVVMEDWMHLLRAVEARLTLSVGESTPGPPELRLLDRAGLVRTNVLECVTALDQLHLTMQSELLRRHELELEVFDTRTELAQARADLAHSQAGERLLRHTDLPDGLTEPTSRSHFHERLDAALSTSPMPIPSEPLDVVVICLDLDGFSAVHDSHGHALGDQLLGIMAERLRRAVRASDTVSYMGGDELACLLVGLSGHQQLCRLASSLFDAVSAPVHIGEFQLVVRPSIGIALCPDDGASGEGLLLRAGAARQHAKRQQMGYAFAGQCVVV